MTALGDDFEQRADFLNEILCNSYCYSIIGGWHRRRPELTMNDEMLLGVFQNIFMEDE